MKTKRVFLIFMMLCIVFSASVLAEEVDILTEEPSIEEVSVLEEPTIEEPTLSQEPTIEEPTTETNKPQPLSLVIPEALKLGDKVAIVAPANSAVMERLLLAEEFLTEKGFEVVIAENIDVHTPFGVADGNEFVRADAFNKLARDPEIKAIICLRGGYGSMHLLPYLDYEALRQNRPIFVGYSDITAMQVAILQNAGLVTFHGPMLSSNLGQEEAFDLLFDMLMNPQAAFALTNIDGTEFSVINEGTAHGAIVGGNMTLISSLMGTPYEMDLKDKVLFIEELDEAPYRLHRYIWQLKLAGMLDEVAAIVIGDILPDREYADPEISLKVIFEALKDVTAPIIYNVRAGHDTNPFTIPIGATVRIKGSEITVIHNVVEEVGGVGDSNITRAELVALLMDLVDAEIAEPTEAFDDVPESSPYYAAVNNAKALGIVSGGGNNTFRPDENVSVQDMLMMIYSTLGKIGRLPAAQNDHLVRFDDWDEVARYAQEPIQTLAKMCRLGSTLNPTKQVTRTEADIFLYMFFVD
ncbi:MAG: LD-carboxypeptidase [Defluviitaleaceae bacterium]|nr:LD-carboxypeptidase [Defluviitaleaceae bacterium]